MNPHHLNFRNPGLFAWTALGLLLAAFLGLLIGSGEFINLGRVVFAVLLLCYVIFFQHLTWKLALLLCFLDFKNIGLGFTMFSLEMTLFLGGVHFCATWWQRQRIGRPAVLELWSFSMLNTAMLAWLLYIAGHTLFNVYAPYRPQEYAFTNLIKVSVTWAGPIFLILYFSNRPKGIVARSNFPIRVAQLLVVGLLVNLAIAGYHFVSGDFDFSPTDDPADLNSRQFQIPVVNFVDNFYALRGLSPFAMLFGSTFLSSAWMREQSAGTRTLFKFVCLLSIAGAALSGGRATLVFVLLMALALLAVRRRTGIVVAILGAILIAVIMANVFRTAVSRAPELVRRSVNWALIQKDEAAQGSIDSSSMWRSELFHKALDEWRSDPRIFWFGRATYSYGIHDLIAAEINGWDGAMESSLRRGATHNLITDLLITFGLVGLVLYFALQLIFLSFLWQLYRARDADGLARSLALALFIYLGFSFVYGLVGGSTFPIIAAWLFIVLISYLRSAPEVAAAPDLPPLATRPLPVRTGTRKRRLPA